MNNDREKDYKDVLEDPNLADEIGPDEAAVYAAGLTHPDDLALESILSEDWDSVPEPPAPTPEEALNQFLMEEDDIPIDHEEAVVSDEPTQVIPQVDDGISYDEAFNPEETENDTAVYEDATDVPKGRPKRKKGYGLFGIPHIISTAIWLAITVMIGVSLGRILWVCCADVMAFGKPEVSSYIVVDENDTIETISQKLADAHLIRYPGLFQKFAEITKKSDRIKTGTHELSSHLDYNAMINSMVYAGTGRVEIEITFPEGFNCAQTFRLLEEKGVCAAADMEALAAEGDLGDYWFLEGLERGDKYCLEGYLAPDTYRFYTNDDPQNVMKKFLDAFDARFTDIMREKLQVMQARYATMLANGGFSAEYIEANPLTLHQVLTIASVVARETSDEEEGYDIASIFYNRLTDVNYGTMGSDATVYYALGDYYHDMGKLTEEDLNVDSPFNTRKNPGIPPRPICNPGAYALYAALDPNETNYHFFLYDITVSKHLFSETYEEHLQKIEELNQ